MLAARRVSGWPAKVGTFVLPGVTLGLLTKLFSMFYDLYDGYPWRQVFLALAILLSVRGLFHLLVLRPRVRFAASLSVVTALVGLSFGSARIFVGALASNFGVPMARVAVPAWLTPLAGVAFLAFLLIAVVGAASAWGWLEYFGVSTAFRKSPDVLWIFFGALLMLLVVGSLNGAIDQGQKVYSSWLTQFGERRTPEITSDFMYRACVIGDPEAVGRGPGKPYVIPSTHPVVVIEGLDGPGWAWDPEGLPSSEATRSNPVASDVYEVYRVGDGVVTCPKVG